MSPTSRSRRTGAAYSLLLPVWEHLCRRALAGFRRQLVAGPAANTRTLRSILRRHGATTIGREAGFARLARTADLEAAWRQSMPLADFASHQEAFRRIGAGEPDVLFPGRPRLFVSTSGTTGDPKLFPVTARQQNSALRFIALLLPAVRAELIPGLGFRQPASTLLVASRPGGATPGGIPVGNPSGAGIRRILRLAPPFWVYPPAVLTVADYPSALYLHAFYALRARDLGVIEAIYCSHVVHWFGLIERRAADLVRDIATGTLDPELALTPGERAVLGRDLGPDPERARAVELALAAGPDGLATRLWPDLKAFSTVLSGAFAASAPRLRRYAGPAPALYTTVFGATEGTAGINLWLDQPERYALALGACHFEFLPAGPADSGAAAVTVGPAEVTVGSRYELVITNHAGLYRYPLGDVVRIAGFEGTTPVFEFDHRRGNVLDLVGEKTTEQHLSAAMAALADGLPGGPAALVDYALAPDLSAVPSRYTVYVELQPPVPVNPTLMDRLARRLDELLMSANPAYRTLGRANGRLDPPVIRLVTPGTFADLLVWQRSRAAGASANQAKVPRFIREDRLRQLLESAV